MAVQAPGPRRRPTARQRIAARRAEEAARAVAARRRRSVTTGLAVAALLAVAIALVVVVQSSRTSSAGAAVPANTVQGGTAIAVGDAGAPVTLDVYEDFQCPACAEFETRSGTTLAELAADGSAQVVHHPMAFLDRASSDRFSTRALNAAGVVVDAAGPEAYARFAGLLYARQPAEGGAGLSDDELIALAAEVGASGPAVERGIRELVYEDWTRTATDRASRDGVNQTPTVLLDGLPLDFRQLQPAALAAAVRAAG
ncbi:disulfide bond formation protein DsbA [Blastococcus sp. KM273128]|nr:disulfide bond formation protein DsbA [Blastococcus sp. KM273128]